MPIGVIPKQLVPLLRTPDSLPQRPISIEDKRRHAIRSLRRNNGGISAREGCLQAPWEVGEIVWFLLYTTFSRRWLEQPLEACLTLESTLCTLCDFSSCYMWFLTWLLRIGDTIILVSSPIFRPDERKDTHVI